MHYSLTQSSPFLKYLNDKATGCLQSPVALSFDAPFAGTVHIKGSVNCTNSVIFPSKTVFCWRAKASAKRTIQLFRESKNTKEIGKNEI